MNKPLEEIFPSLPEGLHLSDLDVDKIPKHVACIMDGNGRWAKARGQKRLFGHKAGVDSVREVIRCASDIGIKYLSLYSFSTENWARPKEEVIGLMDLFAKSVLAEMDELHKNNVRVQIMGDLSELPDKTRNALEHAADMMKNNTGMTLLPAINYGSRIEIVRAVNNAISEKCRENPDNKSSLKIEEKDIKKHLYSAGAPDPELLIRTSGEYRISNFMMWQIAYSELYITDVLWPDFDRYEFLKALLSFQKRKRRFGGLDKEE